MYRVDDDGEVIDDPSLDWLMGDEDDEDFWSHEDEDGPCGPDSD